MTRIQGGKEIAVYGKHKAEVPVRQRYWKRRRDGIRQRYWKKTTRTKVTTGEGRYEFRGKGKELYQATLLAHRYMPIGYVRVRAEIFVKHPEKYGRRGKWVEVKVES